ncbi:hypothetical protein BDF19DRAFT_417039 [Syncephalis fuscata]|nr:hypothetical protein BDF19DRAFT_417039 [Syncephalis fuscata]
MGRWSQSAYENDLLCKVKTLFQESMSQIIRDNQHDFNFEAFVTSFDENDRSIRRAFDNFVKEVYRRHRKTRYRASPYPDAQNRLRGYSTTDTGSLAALRRNTLSNINQNSNNNGNSSSNSNSDSYTLLRQLTEALHEEVTSISSPVMEMPFSVTADELAEWLELDTDGQQQQQSSSANNDERYVNWANMPRLSRSGTVRPWRSTLASRRDSMASESGHHSSHPSSADTSAAPTRPTSTASSPFLRVLSRLGNTGANGGGSGSHMLDVPGDNSGHNSAIASPNLGASSATPPLGEPNPVAIAAAAAAFRHPLIRARRRSSVVAGAPPSLHANSNTSTSANTSASTSLANTPLYEPGNPHVPFPSLPNFNSNFGSAAFPLPSPFAETMPEFPIQGLDSASTTPATTTAATTPNSNSGGVAGHQERADATRRRLLQLLNQQTIEQRQQHIRALQQQRNLNSQRNTPIITLSSSSSSSSVSAPTSTRLRSMSTTTLPTIPSEVQSNNNNSSSHAASIARTLQRWSASSQQQQQQQQPGLSDTYGALSSLLATPEEETGVDMSMSAPFRRIASTPMPTTTTTTTNTSMMTPTTIINHHSSTTNSSSNNNNNHGNTTVPRTPSPEEERMLRLHSMSHHSQQQ